MIQPLIKVVARGICRLGGFEAICTRCDDARRQGVATAINRKRNLQIQQNLPQNVQIPYHSV